jgi:phytanoyl-CoA hydroxylase
MDTALLDTDSQDSAADRFRPDQLEAALRFYAEHGYVVLAGAVTPALCDAAVAGYQAEVKAATSKFYRQSSSGRLEANRFSEYGFLLNPLLNFQDFRQRDFPRFRQGCLDVALAPAPHRFARTLFGEPAKVVQTMFFEGNPATWAHQDSYYLDSEQIGAMTAAWIALEDIAEGAGRFFICPDSHKMDASKHAPGQDIADNHDAYKRNVRQAMAARGYKVVTPALLKGDVLLWHALTIHGSEETTLPTRSRLSITMHLIPQSHRFLQFHSRIKSLNIKEINGIQVHHPKDQESLRNRAIAWVEDHFPTLFYGLKRQAIRLVVARNGK